MSRHRLFGLSFTAIMLGLAACGGGSGQGRAPPAPTPDPPTVTPAPAPTGNQLGLDYDNEVNRIGATDSQLSRTHTTWIRAFYDVTASVAAANSCDVKDDVNLNELRLLRATYGTKYKVAFSLKYIFTNSNGSQAEPPLSGPTYDAVVSCTNTVLNYVYGSVDLIVSGNEPFITNPPSDMNVVNFYEQLTDNDIAFRAQQATQIPIYVGAFTNLQSTADQTAAVRALLAYANNNSAVAGVDLHLHETSFNGDNGIENARFTNLDGGLVAAVAFARSQVPTKPLMSSEFSLVSYFIPFLQDPISSAFEAISPTYAADTAASVANDPKGNKTVLGFYNYALARGAAGNPVAYQEWLDFLRIGDATTPTWFTDRFVGSNNFLAQSQAFFNQNNFSVATYSVPLQVVNQALSKNPSTPYIINVYWLGALYCNATCPLAPASGTTPAQSQFSLAVPDDYISLQH